MKVKKNKKKEDNLMAYKNTDFIFVKTLHVGYIPHLRTHGPIVNPIKVDVGTCRSMIIAGIELYQLDPVSKLTVKLTLENLYNDKKFDKLVKKTDEKSNNQKENKKPIQVTEVNLTGIPADSVGGKKTPAGEKTADIAETTTTENTSEGQAVADNTGNDTDNVTKTVKENHNKNKNNKK